MTYRCDDIPSLTEMVEAVRAHALAKADYETNGWDYVIEAWSDLDLMEMVRFAKTTGGAITAVWKNTRALNEHREEMMANARIEREAAR